ncbi:MAG: SIMPL domain-containing protein [Akkermansiaceae bacterium]|nr:SIMPL domain-containing protein [Akkermansiaceae bacterium]NNM30734.1 SIMPL domain-containing protein [Akkermansiaceae bacterium]
MSDRSLPPLALPALFLALGIAAAGYFVSRTHYNARVALNTAQAKGLAERRVTANRANWTVSHMTTGTDRSEVTALYRRAEEDQKAIIDVLLEGGLQEGEIDTDVISYSMREYRDENQILVDEKHTLSGYVHVETDNVTLIRKLRSDVNRLLARGINLSNHTPSYHFTKINEVKPEMLKEAARNAKIAAREFAENAGVKVGRIRSARQGVFEVRDAGSTSGDTRKLEKDVRVVITVDFYLTD